MSLKNSIKTQMFSGPIKQDTAAILKQYMKIQLSFTWTIQKFKCIELQIQVLYHLSRIDSTPVRQEMLLQTNLNT